MAKKKKEFIKVKKKKWIEVIAPEKYNKQVIGESLVEDSTTLMDRKLKVNLMTLTRDMKKQSITARFQVKEIKENKAFTKLIGFDIIPSAVRRLVRRRKNRVDNSIILKSKDNIKFRIKPIVITQHRISRAVSCDLRKAVQEMLTESASKMDYEAFLELILLNRLQKELKQKIHKICPVRMVEIRSSRAVPIKAE